MKTKTFEELVPYLFLFLMRRQGVIITKLKRGAACVNFRVYTTVERFCSENCNRGNLFLIFIPIMFIIIIIYFYNISM